MQISLYGQPASAAVHTPGAGLPYNKARGVLVVPLRVNIAVLVPLKGVQPQKVDRGSFRGQAIISCVRNGTVEPRLSGLVGD